MSDATILCDSPRIVVLRDFMSQEECDHMLAITANRRRRSIVSDIKTGKPKVTDYRTGFLTMLKAAEDKVVATLEARVAAVTGTRVVQGEPIQVIGYKKGEQYKPHSDWFDPSLPSAAAHLARGGQRIHTFMVYLQAPKRGGETEFTKLGIKVQPVVGSALMWDDTLVDGNIDRRTEHAGRPVKAGEKVIMTRWIRERAFNGSENALTDGQLAEKLCADAVAKVCKSYKCELRAKPFIRYGRVFATAKVHATG